MFAGLWIAGNFQNQIASLLQIFGVTSKYWSLFFGYLILILLGQAVFAWIFSWIEEFLPIFWRNLLINRIGGAVGNGLYGFIIICFFLLTLQKIPLRGLLGTNLRSSTVAEKLLAAARSLWPFGYARMVNEIDEMFGPVSGSASPGFRVPRQLVTEITIDEASEAELVNLINQERVKAGLTELVTDDSLRRFARDYGRELLNKGDITSTDGAGNDLVARLEARGYTFSAAGENVGVAPTAARAHQGFMESRQQGTILDPEFKRLGVGVFSVPGYGKVIVEDFID